MNAVHTEFHKNVSVSVYNIDVLSLFESGEGQDGKHSSPVYSLLASIHLGLQRYRLN
jgi:hypothetical protein